MDIAEAEVAKAEQPGERGRELVRGGEALGGKAPVLDQLVPLEHADMGLGVPDVDREQHAANLQAPRQPPLAPGRPAARANLSSRCKACPATLRELASPALTCGR